MERIVDVAQFIYDEYKTMSGEAIDELKLHKLLYFSQRESLALFGEPLFSEQFEGWRLGPVSRDVRKVYSENGMQCETQDVSDDSAYLIRNILLQYGTIESWKLSRITHKEKSWQRSRKGLSSTDNGDNPILLDDIREDAEKVRPYDSIWDMYYDEFETVEEYIDDRSWENMHI